MFLPTVCQLDSELQDAIAELKGVETKDNSWVCEYVPLQRRAIGSRVLVAQDQRAFATSSFEGEHTRRLGLVSRVQRKRVEVGLCRNSALVGSETAVRLKQAIMPSASPLTNPSVSRSRLSEEEF